jgi:uncharacterized GH25 family protein
MGVRASTLHAAIAAASLASPAARAHDFWIDFGPAYGGDPNAPLAASFLVGHGRDVATWPVRRERVVSFLDVGPAGAREISADLIFADAGAKGGADLRIASPGSHVVAFETTQAFSELAADQFNDYAELEGLRSVIESRKAHGRSSDPGRELYSRRAKAIVQIGAAPTDNVSLPIGQTLEITPEKNPLLLAADEPLVLRVTWRGEPLAGALVDLESLNAGLLPETTLATDGEGRVAFIFPHRGAWKLDVVWAEPLEGDSRADFMTVFSSLTFGFDVAPDRSDRGSRPRP